jgi:2-polyprenyl-6-methoxyphenol hydroxylase-like FAD-dependent oxidoreductase
MTDKEGRTYPISLPVSHIRDEIRNAQKKHADDILPTVFSTLVKETKLRSVQVIADVISPRPAFCGDKVILIGDSLAGFRPHTAASTNQAAYHALLLGRWFGRVGGQGCQAEEGGSVGVGGKWQPGDAANSGHGGENGM